MLLITDAVPPDESEPPICFVNDAFLRGTGYTRDEVIGSSRLLVQGPLTNQAEFKRVHKALGILRAHTHRIDQIQERW